MAGELVRRAEACFAELGREQYRALAGLEPRPELAAIYGRYADLFDDDALLAAEDAGADPAAARRARALREFLVVGRAERVQARLLDERLAWEANRRLAGVEGEPTFRAAAAALSNTADAARRWALEDARLAALREVEALDRERFAREWEVFRGVGGAGFPAAWESLSGIALAPIVEAARALIADTEPVYRELLAYELPRRVGLPVERARAVDRLRLERMPAYDDVFGVADPLAVARRQLAELGLDPEAGGRIAFDLEPRPAKWSRPFCSVIRVPDEVVLVLSPAGGWRDWYTFYHELGHALHFAGVDPERPFEDRALGDFSVTEAFARLFERLASDAAWIERYVGLRGGARADFIRLATLVDLVRLRRQAGKLLYEIELHGAASFDGMPDRYADALSTATLLRHDPEAYLDDVDPRFYCVRYLRSWALEAVLREHLRDRFDEDWFRNPRAGPFLAESFAGGQAEDADALARRLTGADLSFDPVRRGIDDALA